MPAYLISLIHLQQTVHYLDVEVGFEEVSLEVLESVGVVSLCVRVFSGEIPSGVQFSLAASTLQGTASSLMS